MNDETISTIENLDKPAGSEQGRENNSRSEM